MLDKYPKSKEYIIMHVVPIIYLETDGKIVKTCIKFKIYKCKEIIRKEEYFNENCFPIRN